MHSGYLESLPPTTQIWTSLWNVYVALGTAAGAAVIGIMVYFILRYRAKGGSARSPYEHKEEGIWGNWKGAVLTLAITGSVLAFVQIQTFQSMALIVPPQSGDPLQINVIGQQWSWTFVYPNGYKSVGNLTVPTGEVVILNITSVDVVHSFTIPDLSVAKDATPGLQNRVWFEATNPGVFTIRCKELCGVGHAFMLAKLTAVSPGAYDRWYAGLGGK